MTTGNQLRLHIEWSVGSLCLVTQSAKKKEKSLPGCEPCFSQCDLF